MPNDSPALSGFQAHQQARLILNESPTITDSTPRTVTGVDTAGNQFTKTFPSHTAMDSWLFSNQVREISSVR